MSLLEGPALVLGTAGALALAPGSGPRARAASVLAVVGAGALGLYDDLAQGAARKGLAGHLGALLRGEVTTGAVKIIGLAVTGVAAAGLVGQRDEAATPPRTAPPRTAPTAVADVLSGACIVAGAANLVNLLDLRPGRALKAVLLATSPLLLSPAAVPGAAPAAVAAASAATLLRQDLAERTMLGDTGANAAGALLGVAAISALRFRGRAALLVGLVALTLASERVSFTRVIESTPLLREFDRWGRRAPGPGSS